MGNLSGSNGLFATSWFNIYPKSYIFFAASSAYLPDHQKSFSLYAYIVHKKILSPFSVCSTVHISFLPVEPGTDSTAFRHDAHHLFLSPPTAQLQYAQLDFLSFFF
jgi:hypothetical protein